jgi:hypothetical protein
VLNPVSLFANDTILHGPGKSTIVIFQELQDAIQSLRGSESPTSAHPRLIQFRDSTAPEKSPSGCAFSGQAVFSLVLVM